MSQEEQRKTKVYKEMRVSSPGKIRIRSNSPLHHKIAQERGKYMDTKQRSYHLCLDKGTRQVFQVSTRRKAIFNTHQDSTQKSDKSATNQQLEEIEEMVSSSSTQFKSRRAQGESSPSLQIRKDLQILPCIHEQNTIIKKSLDRIERAVSSHKIETDKDLIYKLQKENSLLKIQNEELDEKVRRLQGQLEGKVKRLSQCKTCSESQHPENYSNSILSMPSQCREKMDLQERVAELEKQLKRKQGGNEHKTLEGEEELNVGQQLKDTISIAEYAQQQHTYGPLSPIVRVKQAQTFAQIAPGQSSVFEGYEKQFAASRRSSLQEQHLSVSPDKYQIKLIHTGSKAIQFSQSVIVSDYDLVKSKASISPELQLKRIIDNFIKSINNNRNSHPKYEAELIDKIRELETIKRTISQRCYALKYTYEDFQNRMLESYQGDITRDRISDILTKHPFLLWTEHLKTMLRYLVPGNILVTKMPVSVFTCRMIEFFGDLPKLTPSREIELISTLKRELDYIYPDLLDQLEPKANCKGTIHEKHFRTVLEKYFNQTEIDLLVSQSVVISKDVTEIQYLQFLRMLSEDENHLEREA